MTAGQNAAMGQQWEIEINEGGERQRVPLAGSLSIGRSHENDIVLRDPRVSRRHARLSVMAGGVLVDASASRAGVVDGRGQRAQQLVLRHGDVCSIGQARLRAVVGVAVPGGGATVPAPGPGQPVANGYGYSLSWNERGARRSMPVTRPLTIGRAAGNDIIVNDQQVSRRHAVVAPGPNGLAVDASASRNGIGANGGRLRTATLRAGEGFSIGGTTFAVVPGHVGRAPSTPGSLPLVATLGAAAAFLLIGVIAAIAIIIATHDGGTAAAEGELLAEKQIKASEGGVLEVPGGGPKVTIPPGALEKDTKASIRRVPPKVNLPGNPVGSVYRIDAGKLKGRVTLEIPYNEAVGTQDVQLMYLDESSNAWVAVPAQVSAGRVSYDTAHLSDWVVTLAPSAQGVYFRLPFEGSQKYSGGPHQFGREPYCAAQPGNSSGLDFAFAGTVLSLAQGTVVGIQDADKQAGDSKLDAGIYVTLKHSDGLYVSYWHMATLSPELSKLKAAVDGSNGGLTWEKLVLPAGFPLGTVGSTGDQVDKNGKPVVHLHLELLSFAPNDTDGKHRPDSGEVTRMTWHGRMIDGWQFWQHVDAKSTLTGYSYQGSATRGPVHQAAITMDPGCGRLATAVTATEAGDLGKEQAGETATTCAGADPATPCTVFAGLGSLPSTNCRSGVDINGTNVTFKDCNGHHEDAPLPGGSWTTVEWTGNYIHLAASVAKGAPTAPELAAVQFTFWHAQVGTPDTKPWVVGCRVSGTAGSAKCDIPTDKFPDTVKVSFDIFDTAGRVAKAPDSTRELHRPGQVQGVSCPPTCSPTVPKPSVTTEPPPSPSPGLTSPAAPSDVQVQYQAGSLRVAWRNNASNQDGFRVWLDGALRQTTGRDAREVSLAYPQPPRSTTACVQVAAFNGAGESGHAQGCANIPGPTEPPSPPRPALPAMPSQVELHWELAGAAPCNVGELPNYPRFQSVDFAEPPRPRCAVGYQARVTWRDNANNEDGFHVWRDGVPRPDAGRDAQSTVVATNDLATGARVCVQVAAFNNAGESARGEACGNVPAPVYFELSLSLPYGTTYHPGNPVAVCYHLTPENVPFRIIIERWSSDGPESRLFDALDNGVGGGDCATFVMGAPGDRLYRAQALINGQVVAVAYAYATVAASSGIWLPAGSWALVTITHVDSISICDGDLGLVSPSRTLFTSYRDNGGASVTVGPFTSGLELVFWLDPYLPCFGPYRSNDSVHARVTQVSSTVWNIQWEDGGDTAYNDIWIRVEIH